MEKAVCVYIEDFYSVFSIQTKGWLVGCLTYVDFAVVM